jgi:hypothetical protein
MSNERNFKIKSTDYLKIKQERFGGDICFSKLDSFSPLRICEALL